MSEKQRHLSASPTEADRVVEPSLRPRSIDEYIGQTDALANLKVFIEAANKRGDSLDHLLFHGPPGLGKTSLAHVIANEMDVQIRVTAGPAIERAGDLVAILTNLEPGDVLFIDEIHRLHRTVEEVLYPAMEDYKVDIVLGQGPAARTMTVPLARFTLIGATTRYGLLTGPLRNRFGLDVRLDYYQPSELQQIVTRAAGLLKVEITTEGASELARRARGTPRIANRLLSRARDFAQVEGDGVVDGRIARLALSRLQVDEIGFDKMDRRILETIIDKFGGGPVGIDTLAAALSEETGTIEEVYEPFLIQGGYLQRTPRGRVASRLAYEHLGRELQTSSPGTLFD